MNNTDTRTAWIVAAAIAVPVLVALAVVLARIPVRTETTAVPPDGTVVEVGDGLVYFLWDGGKQRIQQPAALDEDDLEMLGIDLGEPAPALLTLGDAGSRFVMYPADGEESRLYLEDDGRLYEVQVVKAPADLIERLPDLGHVVVNRVRIPQVWTQ